MSGDQYVHGNQDEKGAMIRDYDQDMRNTSDNQVAQDVDTARQDGEDVSELYIWGSKYYLLQHAFICKHF